MNNLLTLSMLPDQYISILRRMKELGGVYASEIGVKQKPWIADMVRMKLVSRDGSARTWLFAELTERGQHLLQEGWAR